MPHLPSLSPALRPAPHTLLEVVKGVVERNKASRLDVAALQSIINRCIDSAPRPGRLASSGIHPQHISLSNLIVQIKSAQALVATLKPGAVKQILTIELNGAKRLAARETAAQERELKAALRAGDRARILAASTTLGAPSGPLQASADDCPPPLPATPSPATWLSKALPDLEGTPVDLSKMVHGYTPPKPGEVDLAARVVTALLDPNRRQAAANADAVLEFARQRFRLKEVSESFLPGAPGLPPKDEVVTLVRASTELFAAGQAVADNGMSLSRHMELALKHLGNEIERASAYALDVLAERPRQPSQDGINRAIFWLGEQHPGVLAYTARVATNPSATVSDLHTSRSPLTDYIKVMAGASHDSISAQAIQEGLISIARWHYQTEAWTDPSIIFDERAGNYLSIPDAAADADEALALMASIGDDLIRHTAERTLRSLADEAHDAIDIWNIALIHPESDESLKTLANSWLRAPAFNPRHHTL